MNNNWIINNNLKKDKLIPYLLKSRNIEADSYDQFISQSKESLLNPYLFSDMNIIIKNITEAKKNREKICIYGDYDVDGISSVSILLKTFNFMEIDSTYYIPKRIEEGYGINTNALDLIKSWGVDIVITVDCGITSIQEVNYANEIGLKMIITDHHESKAILPKAIGILNPKLHNCNYPFKFLCGAGIALKISQALISNENSDLFDELIEIASIATIADIVTLTGENRTIVKCGLESLKKSKNIGLKALIEISGMDNKTINSSNIAFILSPRINSTGRMGNPNIGVDLLTSSNYLDALNIARRIEELNRDRQKVELEIYEQVLEIINNKKIDGNVIVASSKDWHSGVIGIVASKITEKFHKPSVIIAIENDHIGKGSARSIEGFNLFLNLNKLNNILLKYGGHDQAAGITIHESLIEKFDQEINLLADKTLSEEILQKNISVDTKVDINDIDLELYNMLNQLEPFGIGNKKPIFYISNVHLENFKFIGKTKKHFKADLNSCTEMIAFNKNDLIENINPNSNIDIVFEIDKNTYNNKEKIQLLIKDIKNSYNRKYAWQIMYNRLLDIKSQKNIYEFNIQENKFEIIDTFKLLNLKGKKLILCYNPNIYIDLLEKLYYININPSLEIDKIENEYTIILLPNIDKLDLSIYNNIIIYNKEYLLFDATCFLQENNLFKMTHIGNEEDLLPKKEIFITLYKIIIRKSIIDLDILNLCNFLKISFFNLITILEVFKDLKFIKYKINFDNGLINIEVNENNKKSNLEDSITMIEIKRFFNL